jgi:hypothetical protein
MWPKLQERVEDRYFVDEDVPPSVKCHFENCTFVRCMLSPAIDAIFIDCVFIQSVIWEFRACHIHGCRFLRTAITLGGDTMFTGNVVDEDYSPPPERLTTYGWLMKHFGVDEKTIYERGDCSILNPPVHVHIQGP